MSSRTALLVGALGLGLAATVPLAATASSSGPPSAGTRAAAVTARVQVASPRNPTNPLAGHRWGVYKGSADPAWDPYTRARGTTRQQLATIALTPKAKFFGKWIPNSDIARKVREYIANATGGDRNVLVQLTLFRMQPWEAEACRRLPTKAERASYRRYVDTFARQIGRTYAAVVVQPDGPVARCAPGGGRVPLQLLRYTTRRLEAQPNTSVYLEMGSADWFSDKPGDAVRLLLAAGVAQARGFALNTSHFDSVGRQIAFGRKIVAGLARRGVPGRHFVIDTSDNGRPFTGKWWHQRHGDTPLGHAQPCRRAGQRHCVALGIPPTTDVAAPRWGLPPRLRRAAATNVDAYLWISRPWLYNQAGSFDLKRALAVIRYSPYR